MGKLNLTKIASLIQQKTSEDLVAYLIEQKTEKQGLTDLLTTPLNQQDNSAPPAKRQINSYLTFEEIPGITLMHLLALHKPPAFIQTFLAIINKSPTDTEQNIPGIWTAKTKHNLMPIHCLCFNSAMNTQEKFKILSSQIETLGSNEIKEVLSTSIDCMAGTKLKYQGLTLLAILSYYYKYVPAEQIGEIYEALERKTDLSAALLKILTIKYYLNEQIIEEKISAFHKMLQYGLLANLIQITSHVNLEANDLTATTTHALSSIERNPSVHTNKGLFLSLVYIFGQLSGEASNDIEHFVGLVMTLASGNTRTKTAEISVAPSENKNKYSLAVDFAFNRINLDSIRLEAKQLSVAAFMKYITMLYIKSSSSHPVITKFMELLRQKFCDKELLARYGITEEEYRLFKHDLSKPIDYTLLRSHFSRPINITTLIGPNYDFTAAVTAILLNLLALDPEKNVLFKKFKAFYKSLINKLLLSVDKELDIQELSAETPSKGVIILLKKLTTIWNKETIPMDTIKVRLQELQAQSKIYFLPRVMQIQLERYRKSLALRTPIACGSVFVELLADIKEKILPLLGECQLLPSVKKHIEPYRILLNHFYRQHHFKINKLQSGAVYYSAIRKKTDPIEPKHLLSLEIAELHFRKFGATFAAKVILPIMEKRYSLPKAIVEDTGELDKVLCETLVCHTFRNDQFFKAMIPLLENKTLADTFLCIYLEDGTIQLSENQNIRHEKIEDRIQFLGENIAKLETKQRAQLLKFLVFATPFRKTDKIAQIFVAYLTEDPQRLASELVFLENRKLRTALTTFYAEPENLGKLATIIRDFTDTQLQNILSQLTVEDYVLINACKQNSDSTLANIKSLTSLAEKFFRLKRYTVFVGLHLQIAIPKTMQDFKIYIDHIISIIKINPRIGLPVQPEQPLITSLLANAEIFLYSLEKGLFANQPIVDAIKSKLSSQTNSQRWGFLNSLISSYSEQDNYAALFTLLSRIFPPEKSQATSLKRWSSQGIFSKEHLSGSTGVINNYVSPDKLTALPWTHLVALYGGPETIKACFNYLNTQINTTYFTIAAAHNLTPLHFILLNKKLDHDTRFNLLVSQIAKLSKEQLQAIFSHQITCLIDEVLTKQGLMLLDIVILSGLFTETQLSTLLSTLQKQGVDLTPLLLNEKKIRFYPEEDIGASDRTPYRKEPKQTETMTLLTMFRHVGLHTIAAFMAKLNLTDLDFDSYKRTITYEAQLSTTQVINPLRHGNPTSTESKIMFLALVQLFQKYFVENYKEDDKKYKEKYKEKMNHFIEVMVSYGVIGNGTKVDLLLTDKKLSELYSKFSTHSEYKDKVNNSIAKITWEELESESGELGMRAFLTFISHMQKSEITKVFQASLAKTLTDPEMLVEIPNAEENLYSFACSGMPQYQADSAELKLLVMHVPSDIDNKTWQEHLARPLNLRTIAQLTGDYAKLITCALIDLHFTAVQPIHKEDELEENPSNTKKDYFLRLVGELAKEDHTWPDMDVFAGADKAFYEKLESLEQCWEQADDDDKEFETYKKFIEDINTSDEKEKLLIDKLQKQFRSPTDLTL